MHTILAQNWLEGCQFFCGSGGDVTHAAKCVSHLKPAKPLQTHKGGLQNLPEVQNGLQKGRSEALLTQIS